MLRILKNHEGKVRQTTFDEIKSLDVDWIDCYKPDEKELALLVKKTKLPINRLRVYLHDDGRPHVLEMKNFSLVVFAAPIIKDNTIKRTIVSIFLFGSNNILTLHNEKIDALERVEKHIKEGHLNLLDNPSHFLFALLDEITNDYFNLLERLQEDVDLLEEQIVKNPKITHTEQILNFKKNVIYVHKALTANREVIVNIEKGYLSRIEKGEIDKYRFIYNDIVQLIDMNETYRDVLTGALEIYLTTISNNFNHTVKRLTAWGSLILIPTLIASIYGMNFHDTASPFNMPELTWKYGYFFALGVMALSTLLLYFYFRKKDWIR